MALKYASDRLRNDKEVVFKAVKKDFLALEFASDELKNDKEFIKIINLNDEIFIMVKYLSDKMLIINPNDEIFNILKRRNFDYIKYTI
jgi:hypothetical protein